MAIMITCLPVIFMPAVAHAACTSYEFIGARGSGQSPQPGDDPGDYSAADLYGMGSTVYAEYAKLTGLAGADKVSAYGVHYPAVGIFGSIGDDLNGLAAITHISLPGGYYDSVNQGSADIIGHIETVHAACPDTRFLLAGYSQGANAAGNALQQMPAADRALVAGMTLFGDPYFNVGSWSAVAGDPVHNGIISVRDEWPADTHGKVWSYCHLKDPICGVSRHILTILNAGLYLREFWWASSAAPHENYATTSNPDTDDAARHLARLIGVSTAVSGNVPVDLAFAIDTTGSMGPYIADVQANVNALAQAIASTSTSYRFALVDYKDGPQQGDPYKAQVDLPFGTDVSAFSTAVNGLSANGGGDLPESVYSGIMTALNLQWRDGVRKVVIPIGDAPGKDPEDDTGYTLSTVVSKALSVDPAQVFPVALSTYGPTQTFMQALADGTGGKLSQAPNQSTFVSTLESAILAAGSSPVADAGGSYTGNVGIPVALTGGNSRDDTENITAYDWDFNGDGTYDQTTADPVVSHTWDTPGTYTVVMRTRTASGLAAKATATVTISAVPSAPAAPANLTGTAGDGSATLTWQTASAGGAPQWFTITDSAGNLIDRVAANPDGSAPTGGWIDPGLVNGSSYTYNISAGNVAGESPAVTVTVVPHAPDRPPVATGDSYATDAGAGLSVPAPGVLVNDTDPDAGDKLTAVAVSQPAHGTLTLNSDGSFSYVPAAGFTGTDSFTYEAKDSAGMVSAPATVTITVNGVSAGGRFILVASGHPRLVTYGALKQPLTITLNKRAVTAVTGQTSYVDKDGKTRTVNISVHCVGICSATIKYGDGTTTRTYSGVGLVHRLKDGRIFGAFVGKTGPFGFGYAPPK